MIIYVSVYYVSRFSVQCVQEGWNPAFSHVVVVIALGIDLLCLVPLQCILDWSCKVLPSSHCDMRALFELIVVLWSLFNGKHYNACNIVIAILMIFSCSLWTC